jgi:hypothetical protein
MCNRRICRRDSKPIQGNARADQRKTGPQVAHHAHDAVPIKLQAHGDPSPPISFRNIWVRELR